VEAPIPTTQDYARPDSLPEALALVAGGGWRVLAGGTDLYPATQTQVLAGPILDITALADLRGIATQQGGLCIGACTTWAEIVAADLPPALHMLQQAAVEVGGRQIQTAGTIGGNLCNASPAADGVPPLLALDAEVEIAGPGGTRRLPLSAFLTGPRRTALGLGEILTGVTIPAQALAGRSAFLKLGARRHLVISIAMVAARVVAQGGRVAQVALAVGACSAVAVRLPGVEAALAGASLDQAAARIDDAAVAAALSPLDDLRGTAAYRAQAAAELLRRAVAQAAGQDR
jgi:CO/xanthine dehydrogenase FAD-binding subunit